jgi:hypothetical protein
MKIIDKEKLTVEKIGDKLWRVSNKGCAIELSDGRVLKVQDGFETDFHDLPKGLVVKLLDAGAGAILAAHAYMYTYGACQFYTVTKAFANKCLLEGLKELGIGWYKRWQSREAFFTHCGGAWKRHHHPEK